MQCGSHHLLGGKSSAPRGGNKLSARRRVLGTTREKKTLGENVMKSTCLNRRVPLGTRVVRPVGQVYLGKKSIKFT